MSNLFGEERDDKTVDWMRNPVIGMRFSEMYTYWVHIVAMPDNYVIVMDTPGTPCTLPDDGVIREFDSVDEFRRYYAYGGSTPGYWVRANEMIDVDGWYDYAVANGNVVLRNGERKQAPEIHCHQ